MFQQRLKAPWWSLFPILHAFLVAFWMRPVSPNDFWVQGSFLAIVTLAARFLFLDPKPYSINRMFWLFQLIFFGLMPSIQYGFRTIPWGNDFSGNTVIKANLIILLGIGAYQLARWIADSLWGGRPVRILGRVDRNLLHNHRTVGVVVFILVCLAYIVIAGPRNMFIQQKLDYYWLSRVSETTFLIAEKLLRGPVLYFTLLSIFLYRLHRIRFSFLAWVLLGMLVVNFPFSMPRTLTAGCYIAILLSFGPRLWVRYKNAFSMLIVALLFVVFPMIKMARWNAERRMAAVEAPRHMFSESYGGGDFDAHSSLCRTVNYVHTHGQTSGKQLLTSLAFAIPRKVWPQKSIGSGALVYKAAGKEFTNVSSPLAAEGYIDFGLLGTLIYMGIFALIAFRYDAYYWHWKLHRAKEGDVSFPLLFYPFMLVMFFLLLRGDLLSTMAAIAGFYAAGYFFHGLLRLPLTRHAGR